MTHQSDQDISSSSKLWGGRFQDGLDPTMELFNASLPFDQRMWKEDISGSIVYAQNLVKHNLITREECDLMVDGLNRVAREWDQQKFLIKPGDEDIHTSNERRLKELIGVEVGGKLHVGRSRNDQVGTDMKMWLRNGLEAMHLNLKSLIQSMVQHAKEHLDIIFPGYTHLQRAQAVLWSHWVLSYAMMFQQDCQRLESLHHRMNTCPLGSGALAGNPFPIDRHLMAQQLGFRTCTQNSMQAVGDRDDQAEFLFWCSLSATHFSRLAEDLILYSTKEFGYVTISDAYSTGSSLMPQKKNADSLELIRGKTGRLVGNAVGLLVVLKGLPSTFNKDLQEDKEGMFDSYDTMRMIIPVTQGVISTLTVPFREAHEVSGRVVAKAEQLACDITEVPLSELKLISDKFTEDIHSIWDYEKSIDQYQAQGGTSKSSVLHQMQQLTEWMAQPALTHHRSCPE